MNEQDTIQANVKKFEDINELKSLIKQQRVFEKSLKLLYDHCTTDAVKQAIFKRTGSLAHAYQDWANSPAWEKRDDGCRAPKSAAIAIDGIKTIIAYYEALFDELDTITPYLKDAENTSSQQFSQLLSLFSDMSKRIDCFVKDRNKTKPADSLSYDVAVMIMRKICGSDAVSERTIREWIDHGKASKADLKISFNDLKSIQTWTAWCQSYSAQMTSRLRTKIALSEATQKED